MADTSRIDGLSGTAAILGPDVHALQRRRHGVVLEHTRIWAPAPAGTPQFFTSITKSVSVPPATILSPELA